ncbi:MAG: formate dehydrogenase accessory sulfurtransferase FdhD [Bacteroidia bacterium]|nr:formate dehydrogenase accessory sulfurtransferase FdhD [Bacteroidia bacterium]
MEIKRFTGLRFSTNHAEEVQDDVTVEVALSISVNQIPFTVTMQTPGDEFDLARGLMLTENLLRNSLAAPRIEILSRNKEGHIDSVNLTIPEENVSMDLLGKRNLISASSCGICGKTSLEGMSGPPLDNQRTLDAAAVGKMFEFLNRKQLHFQRTGGTHAAGMFTLEGEALSVREDIGRHNAVDKVIGDLLNRGLLEKARLLTVSGRISFEIVSKAHLAGISFVASVSAPSSLAVEYARESGISLLAFCRNGNFTAYTHTGKVKILSPVT